MRLELIYLNSAPVVAVNCDNRKAMGKKNGTKQSSKNGSIELREKNNKQKKKTMTKWKSNFKSTNS